MPSESLATLCGLLNQIEADTQALVARMDAVNEQAARFSVPVGWENTSESFLSQVKSEEFYLEKEEK